MYPLSLPVFAPCKKVANIIKLIAYLWHLTYCCNNWVVASWEQYVVREYDIVLFYKFCTKPYATPLFDVTKTDNRFKLNKNINVWITRKLFFVYVLWNIMDAWNSFLDNIEDFYAISWLKRILCHIIHYVVGVLKVTAGHPHLQHR